MMLPAALLVLAAPLAAPLSIPATWIALDPRMRALLPHGTVLRATERVRWGAITVRDYELAVKLDKVDLELERLTAIARDSKIDPMFLPNGVMRVNAPGFFMDLKATPSTGSITVKYSLDDARVAIADALHDVPTCDAITQLAKRGTPKVLEHTRADSTPEKTTLTVRVGKTDETASCP